MFSSQNISGRAQKNAIRELLEFYVNVIVMIQDTTAANVGKDKGVFMRVCKELDLCLLRIDCRRHVIELEVKHYAMAIIGRNTSAPCNALLS